MERNRRDLRVVQGGRSAPAVRLALSLVHPRGRIDIPVDAIVWIVAYGEGQGPWPFHNPHVEVCFAPAIRKRIYDLTQHIVDEPMDIVVCGERISSPIVREPLGQDSSFRISAYDLAEAQELADQMRTGWMKAGPRVIAGRDVSDG
jgi:hypothetical protein